MNPDDVERKLAAILSADVVGYSRLMAADEAATVRRLTDYREAIAMLIRQHRGRVVDSSGDNVLAEFPTATDAVSCAVEIQGVLNARNAPLPEDHKMEFRVGIHLGEVRVEGERLYGDGVNIAARLEGLAQPGGICISAMVHSQVHHKLDLGYEDLGKQELKNIPDTVQAYRVRLASEPGIPTESLPGMNELTVPGFGGRPAIAVLPFDNLSGDPEQEYFADGIAEDLITRLSAWRDIPIIARNSSFTYRGRSIDVKQVSRELGVRYVVEGSVRKAGDRVRISAQLIDASTGGHVWAERYDRELQDIFALQDEITEAIVASLHPELLRFERERVARRDPQNLDAWETTQRGWWHFLQVTKEDNAKARSIFEAAIELDPQLVEACSGLASTHYIDLVFQWTDSVDRCAVELVRAAQRAVAIDDQNPMAQFALARADWVTGQREKSIAACELAVQLNPSYAFAYFALGVTLAHTGRPDDAIANIEKGMRLSPRDPMLWYSMLAAGMAHFAAGRYENAAHWTQQSLQRKPDHLIAYLYHAASCAHLGRADEARRALEGMLRSSPTFSLAFLRRFLAASDPDYVERLLDGLRKAGLKE